MQDLLPIVFFILTAFVFFLFGLAFQRYLGKTATSGKRIEEYPFYPFIKNKQGHIEFNFELFNRGVQHFIAHRDQMAARQLIIIGEQNFVTGAPW